MKTKGTMQEEFDFQKRIKNHASELYEALELSQQWLIKIRDVLPASELKNILQAGIDRNNNVFKKIEL